MVLVPPACTEVSMGAPVVDVGCLLHSGSAGTGAHRPNEGNGVLHDGTMPFRMASLLSDTRCESWLQSY
jgi:hypothetical protein